MYYISDENANCLKAVCKTTAIAKAEKQFTESESVTIRNDKGEILAVWWNNTITEWNF